MTGIFAEKEHELAAALEDFQDPSQEWRRLFSELLGTFFLVLVAAGGGMMGQAFPDTISRTAAVVAPGLMVMGIILFMGKVSGAHLNPAVTLAVISNSMAFPRPRARLMQVSVRSARCFWNPRCRAEQGYSCWVATVTAACVNSLSAV